MVIRPRSLPVSSRTERGYFLPEIPTVPMKSRKPTATWRQPDGPPVAIAFVDGQNLFHAARRVFGRQIPDYDVLAMSRRVCEMQGWIEIVSAFPSDGDSESDGDAESIRGVNNTDWVRIDRDTYDLCLDPRDHFPPD